MITKLCAIVTGRDIILSWALEALDPTADLQNSQCMMLPRLDAYMAALLTEPKHIKGDLGIQFQSYVEQCQMHRVSPKGRFMLQFIAQRFQLDLNRGANLTQQPLLELNLESFNVDALQKFIERIELVLNSIPPTSLVALNVAIWYACRKGNAASCSDAIQAFLQSELDDNDLTYVIIPTELWLDEWHKKFQTGTKLVVRLKKSLYGHPRAGRWWQDHLDRRLRNFGAQELPMYPSNYIVPWKIGNETITLLLNVYVDDLTLCGDQRCHTEFWTQLRKSVKIEPEQFILGQEGTLILGRKHTIKVEDQQITSELDMRSYADSIVDTYWELTCFDKSRFRSVPTPHIPEASASEEDLSQTGGLGKDASRILMRLLWLSRLTRPDLAFIVTRLASRVTTWSKFEDRQLHRCVAYLNTSKDVILKGCVSHQNDIRLDVYTDADFAGCVHSVKSTSGLWIEISSTECAFPLYWQSKRQSSIARSTTEAELIAMANGLYGEVYNLQSFIQQLIGGVVEVKFFRDNSAVLQVLEAGYSARLRHCGRVHKVKVASVSFER